MFIFKLIFSQDYFKHSRFEPKGGASLKQRKGKERKGERTSKRAESEKALEKALDACFRNGCSVPDVENIVCKAIKKQKR